MINEKHARKDAAAKASINLKTARQYLKGDSTAQTKDHNRQTRKNKFESVWSEINEMLT